MDGDSSAKAMEAGANSAMNATDFTEGIHETATNQQDINMGEKTTGTGTPAFSSEGAVGKEFTTDGSIGGTAEAIGGPFDSSGSVGKHFTESGSIGGKVDQELGKKE